MAAPGQAIPDDQTIQARVANAITQINRDLFDNASFGFDVPDDVPCPIATEESFAAFERAEADWLAQHGM